MSAKPGSLVPFSIGDIKIDNDGEQRALDKVRWKLERHHVIGTIREGTLD